MTEQSFTNYQQNLVYLHTKNTNALVCKIQIGNQTLCDMMYNIISESLLDLVFRYDLSNDLNRDGLTVPQMQKVAYTLNKIHKTNYNITFEL